jgi:hypothetical protein
MQGLLVFHTLAEALHAGYTVCGRTAEGYKVHISTAKGFQMALVVLRG